MNSSYNVFVLLPIGSVDVRVGEMDRDLRQHEAYIRRCLEEDRLGTDWAALLAYHRAQVAFLQHERLIHLAITLFFALFALMGIMLLIFLPSLSSALLAGLVLVLVGGYLVHYYKLENGVQRLYRLDWRLEERRGAIPRALSQ
jgi:hypothetical protein